MKTNLLKRSITTFILCVGFLYGFVANAADRPNIIFIYADDWGWGDLSLHGHEMYKTPHLDRLAAEGTEFIQFSVNNPVCSPSRTAVMTGHFPGRHCVHQHFASVEHHVKAGMPDWLDPQAPLLQRMLKEAGYVTGHFGKWHMTNRHVPDAPLPSEYGYDEYGVFNSPGPQIKPDTACEKAEGFIRRHKDKPFFINLWIHETHTPHYPKDKWMKKFEHLDEQHQVYAAIVADADARIGKLLGVLKELELDEKTLVVFSSDNGPENTGTPKRKRTDDNSTGPGLGSYYSVGATGGLKGQKRSLYEGGIRTPFLVRWPGKVPAGKVNKTMVITGVDMLPTFCAAAGVEWPKGYTPDGENVLPAFLGKPMERTKPIFWEWRGARSGTNWPRLGVRSGPWKLLTTFEFNRNELYRVEEDRAESNNLAEKNPEVVQRLIRLIKDWKTTLPAKPPAHCFSKSRKK